MSKLIIAAAGSGKTTYIVREALKIKQGKILITTFTDANEQGIRDKFYEEYGCIPSNVTIIPWFTFLLKHGIRPYQSYITEKDINGINMVNGIIPELRYIKESSEKHYITSSGKVYSDKLSKMTCKINELSGGCVFDRLTKLYTHFYFDEVQDFAGYDLEIIKEICGKNQNVLLVGDVRQVTYQTHFEAKNKKYANGGIVKYVKDRIETMTVDETSLNTSHRNNKTICNFANSLYPDMIPCDSDMNKSTEHDGIFWVHETQVDEYLRTYSPVQLRSDSRTKVNEDFMALSFGASKGLSFDRVLIYPTKPILDCVAGKSKELAPRSRAKFYVAITRARYSIAFVYKTKNPPTNKVGTKWE